MHHVIIQMSTLTHIRTHTHTQTWMYAHSGDIYGPLPWDLATGTITTPRRGTPLLPKATLPTIWPQLSHLLWILCAGQAGRWATAGADYPLPSPYSFATPNGPLRWDRPHLHTIKRYLQFVWLILMATGSGGKVLPLIVRLLPGYFPVVCFEWLVLGLALRSSVGHTSVEGSKA